MVQNVSVGKDRYLDRLLDSLDLFPIGQTLRHEIPHPAMFVSPPSLRDRSQGNLKTIHHLTYRQLTFHVPSSTVAGEDLGASRFEHFGVRHSLFHRIVDTELCRDGNVEVEMELVD